MIRCAARWLRQKRGDRAWQSETGQRVDIDGTAVYKLNPSPARASHHASRIHAIARVLAVNDPEIAKMLEVTP